MLFKAKSFILSMLCALGLIAGHSALATPQHSEVFKAIARMNEDRALELLQQHEAVIRQNPNLPIPGSEDADRRTLLHFAVEHEQPRVVRLLIQYGAKPNQEDIDGVTPGQVRPGQ